MAGRRAARPDAPLPLLRAAADTTPKAIRAPDGHARCCERRRRSGCQRWAESGGWGYGGDAEWNDGDGDAGEGLALELADLWVSEG